MLAQVSLTPSESKKLIAKAIAEMDEIKNAVENGILVLHPSSSTFFIVEEITGSKPDTNAWVCGVVAPRGTCGEVGVWLANQTFSKAVTTDPGAFPHSWVIRKKSLTTGIDLATLLAQMTSNDVYIKGVNAIDPHGNVGILVANLVEGGTIGRVLSAQRKTGFHVLWPVGMEKLIPSSINDAANEVKKSAIDYAMGMPVGLFPCKNGRKIDETDAIRMLSSAIAIPIAAGGLGGAEGAVTLIIKGDEDSVKKAVRFVEMSKGAQLPQIRLSSCSGCVANGLICKSNMGEKHWVKG